MLPLARSLWGNKIGVKGATALAAILNETKITHLKCAAARAFAFVSAPVDTFANTSSLPCAFLLASTSEHISFLVPSPSSLLLPARLPHSHPRDAALDRAPRPPGGRITGTSRIPTHPLATSRRSLQVNSLDFLDSQTEQIAKDAAGSGVSITF